jgi:hypothetical protein
MDDDHFNNIIKINKFILGMIKIYKFSKNGHILCNEKEL